MHSADKALTRESESKEIDPCFMVNRCIQVLGTSVLCTWQLDAGVNLKIICEHSFHFLLQFLKDTDAINLFAKLYFLFEQLLAMRSLGNVELRTHGLPHLVF